MKILYVGIDVSMRDFTTAFLDQDSRLLCKTFSLPNTPEGAKELEERIIALAKAASYKTIYLGIEATAFYGFHLLEHLSLSPMLTEFGLCCYQLNAKRVKAFKSILSEREKTDPEDAVAIAKFLRLGEDLPSPYEGNASYLPLRRLVRYRCHLVNAITRETSYFISNLFLKFPGWLQDRPIAGVNQATARTLLEELSPDDILRMPLEDLVIFVAKAGKNRSPDPKAIALAIQRAAQQSYQLRPALANSVSLVLALTRRNIQALKNSVKELDKAIEDEGKGFIDPLLSIPGIGLVYAAGIAASIGNIRKFHSDDALAKQSGLVWKRWKSGQFQSDTTKLIKSGDRYLRYYLVEAANSLRMHNEEYRTFYQKKYAESKKHPHKRALLFTARKLVRLVFALLSKNQNYSPAYAYQCAGQSQA